MRFYLGQNHNTQGARGVPHGGPDIGRAQERGGVSEYPAEMTFLITICFQVKVWEMKLWL